MTLQRSVASSRPVASRCFRWSIRLNRGEPRPLAILEYQSGASVGGIELLRAPTRVPLRLELGQEALDLVEVHPIGPGGRATVLRMLDARPWDDLLNDRRQVANPVVLLSLAHVERLVVDHLARRGQNGHVRACNVLDVNYRTPGRAVALDETRPFA